MNHQKSKMADGMLVAIIMEIQQCMSVILAIFCLETLLSSVSLTGTGQPNLSVMVGVQVISTIPLLSLLKCLSNAKFKKQH